MLTRPLFTEEWDKYEGLCGHFANPGDGEGQFVPVIMTGHTINLLHRVQHADNVEGGDRVLFDAVVVRDVPASARTAEGSIHYQYLAAAGHRWLDTSDQGILPWDQYSLDKGRAKRKMFGALQWVAVTAINVVHEVQNTMATVYGLFAGTYTAHIQVGAVTGDPAFGPPSPPQGPSP